GKADQILMPRSATPSPPAPDKPSRPAVRILRGALLGVAIGALVIVALAAALAARITMGPLSFGALGPVIAEALSDEERGFVVAFEEGAVAWRARQPDLRDKLSPGIEFRLKNLQVRNRAGETLLAVPRA